MRLLLLIHLSKMLLLCFVFLKSFLWLICSKFRMRSSFRQIWIVWSSLLLLGLILLLGFDLKLVIVIYTVDAVLILTSAHHNHPWLVLDWQTLGLSGLWVVLLSIVSRKLVFVLQERILGHIVLLLLWKLLSDRSHHTLVLAGWSVDFINFFLSLIKTCASGLVRLDSVVWALIWNCVL